MKKDSRRGVYQMRTIQNEYLTVQIDEKGAELYSIKDKNGQEYLWQGDSKYWSDRAPNLFPYIARLTDKKYTLYGKTYEMDIHGFAKDMIFETKQISDSCIHFIIKDTEATKVQYPYAFVFMITYSLEGKKLSITYYVKNEDEKTMYFGVGAHPGFGVPMEDGLNFEDYYLEFDEVTPAKRVGFSEDCFVTGEDKLFDLAGDTKLSLQHNMFDDDAIVLVDMARGVTLKSDQGKNAIHVEYPDMPYLGLWHWPKTDAPYICIEPWSSLPSRKDVIEDLQTQPNLISLDAGKGYCNKIDVTIINE